MLLKHDTDVVSFCKIIPQEYAMPIVDLRLIEGYSASDKRRLGEAITDAIRLVIPAPAELVTVMIHDLPKENYYRGRRNRTPASAKSDPCKLVQDYLTAMEARDLTKAKANLAEDFEMWFPGVPKMTSLEELIQWAKSRYTFVTKSYVGFDALQSPEEAAVVYCRGTLSGEWLDGTPFGDIRFIDRFEILNEKITRQEVWNDIAEKRQKL